MKNRTPEVWRVYATVAEVMGVSRDKMVSSCRTHDISRARQVAWCILHDDFKLSFSEIGRATEHHHSSVMHGVLRIRAAIDGSIDVRRGDSDIVPLVEAARQALREVKNGWLDRVKREAAAASLEQAASLAWFAYDTSGITTADMLRRRAAELRKENA